MTGGRPRQGFIVTKALMAVEPPHISCNEAKALGLKHYFTGRPCKYGHVAKRESYAGDWVTRSIRRRGEPAFRGPRCRFGI